MSDLRQENADNNGLSREKCRETILELPELSKLQWLPQHLKPVRTQVPLVRSQDSGLTSRLRSRQSPFRPGVELQESLLKPRGIGMGIELRRIDGGVSKQFLNHAEVGAMRQ